MWDWIPDLWNWLNSDISAGLIGAFIGAAITSGFSALHENKAHRRQREKERRDVQRDVIMELQDRTREVAVLLNALDDQNFEYYMWSRTPVDTRGSGDEDELERLKSALRLTNVPLDRIAVLSDRLENDELRLETMQFINESKGMRNLAIKGDILAFTADKQNFRNELDAYSERLREHFQNSY